MSITPAGPRWTMQRGTEDPMQVILWSEKTLLNGDKQLSAWCLGKNGQMCLVNVHEHPQKAQDGYTIIYPQEI